MSCAHYFAKTEGGDGCFAVDASNIVFGRGALAEAGEHARGLGMSRIALFTDRTVRGLPPVELVTAALRSAGVDAVCYDEVRIEPDQDSLLRAAQFYAQGRFDGAISVGGGSVMDTAKAALVYATYPAPFLRYVNRPIGEGVPLPGALPPHIACPTTSGTGSECTGIAVCSVYPEGKTGLSVKTGLAHRALRPRLALIDPICTETLPASVVAATGFDVLCHAIESYTALPFSRRPRAPSALLRPMSQGANPFSDVGSLEALRLCGQYLLRAVRDGSDREARDQMMYAAALAGIAFGNAGVHVPHAMAYAVGGLSPKLTLAGYPPDRPLIPHGLAVVLCAPAAVLHLAATSPVRHLCCAEALGFQTKDLAEEEVGRFLSVELRSLLAQTGLPNELSQAGYSLSDVPALCSGAALQARLLGNAPRPVGADDLAQLFRDSFDCPARKGTEP